MCIEAIIERGVLETEGVGGYFVCLSAVSKTNPVDLLLAHTQPFFFKVVFLVGGDGGGEGCLSALNHHSTR